MSGGGGGTNTVTEKSDPWAAQQPYLKDIFQQARHLYESDTPEFYPGQTYVEATPEQEISMNLRREYATEGMPRFVQGAMGAAGMILDPTQMLEGNPWLDQAMERASKPITDQLMTQALPAIRSDAVLSGQYGGSRQGLAEAGAISGAADAIGNIATDMAFKNYSEGLTAMQRGLALSPQIAAMGVMPADLMQQVGDFTRQEAMLPLSEAMTRWDFEQNVMPNKLKDYSALVQGGSWGGTRTSSSPYYENQMMGGLSSGMMLGGLGGMLEVPGSMALGSSGMMFNPYTALLGLGLSLM